MGIANRNIKLTPNGSGDILCGSGAAGVEVASSGSYDLTLVTNGGAANEPKIVLTDGATGDITLTAGATSGEIVMASPVVHSSTQSLTSADEAINTTTSIGEFTTDADGTAHGLGDGVEGQIKFLTMISDGGGNAVVTPTNLQGYATITFGDVGDCCILLFTNGNWQVMSNQGCALA